MSNPTPPSTPTCSKDCIKPCDNRPLKKYFIMILVIYMFYYAWFLYYNKYQINCRVWFELFINIGLIVTLIISVKREDDRIDNDSKNKKHFDKIDTIQSIIYVIFLLFLLFTCSWKDRTVYKKK